MGELMSELMSENYTNYQRYLASKKSVDDRALNYRVWQRLGESLGERSSVLGRDASSMRVLELGSGIGTMLERLLENDMLPSCEYVAVDELAANAQSAHERFQSWRMVSTPSATDTAEPLGDYGEAADPCVVLRLEVADLFDYLATAQQQILEGNQQRFDLVIAHAFLDLVDAPAALEQIKAVMQPDGILFTSINFDGATILQPEIDPVLDAHIESLYHRTMDERVINGVPSGESKTGRHLFVHLRDAGFDIAEAGASDWVVFATVAKDDLSTEGRAQRGNIVEYVEDEAYFLHFIVETMHGALRRHPELDQENFRAWVGQRHEQIAAGELVYIAHQLDFLAIPTTL